MVWCGLFPEICVCWLVISQESFLLSFLAFLFFVFSFLWNALKRTTGREKKGKKKKVLVWVYSQVVQVGGCLGIPPFLCSLRVVFSLSLKRRLWSVRGKRRGRISHAWQRMPTISFLLFCPITPLTMKLDFGFPMFPRDASLIIGSHTSSTMFQHNFWTNDLISD